MGADPKQMTDIKDVYRINLKDAESLLKIAIDKGDEELARSARADIRKWTDKLNRS